MKKLAFLILIAVGLAACEPHAYYSQLPGTWVATDWTSVGKDVNLAENIVVEFVFNEDKTYQSTIGPTVEKGTYKCVQDLIKFYPEGKTELPVQVIRLDNAYLQWKMDNNGIEQLLFLEKKQE